MIYIYIHTYIHMYIYSYIYIVREITNKQLLTFASKWVAMCFALYNKKLHYYEVTNLLILVLSWETSIIILLNLQLKEIFSILVC